ncbi:MAG: hypothetical protein V2A65_09130 [Candidatus Omnitrophota bacterium]
MNNPRGGSGDDWWGTVEAPNSTTFVPESTTYYTKTMTRTAIKLQI